MIRAIISEIAIQKIRNKMAGGAHEAEQASGQQQSERQANGQQAARESANDSRTNLLMLRIVALVVDMIPVFFIVLIIQALIAGVSGQSFGLGVGFFVFPAWVIARFAYHTPLEHYFGRTAGKLAAGLKVYGADGESPPSLQETAIRNALRVLDGLFFNLVGFVAAVASKDGQRLGDMAAGTTVLAADGPTPLRDALDHARTQRSAAESQQQEEHRQATDQQAAFSSQSEEPEPEGAAKAADGDSDQQALDDVQEEVFRVLRKHNEYAYVFREPENLLLFDTRGNDAQTVITPISREGRATISKQAPQSTFSHYEEIFDSFFGNSSFGSQGTQSGSGPKIDMLMINGEQAWKAQGEDSESGARTLLCLTRATFQAPDGQPTSHAVTTLDHLEHELLAYDPRRTLDELDQWVAGLDQETIRRRSGRLIYSPPPRQSEQPVSPQPEVQSTSGQSYLSLYAKDLTASARAGNIPPVIGREEQIRQVLRTLSRTTKNNPVLRGEAGVGKTAVAEGLARLAAGIEEGRKVPKELAGMKIHELSISAMESGTTMRGMFEERLEGVLAEVKERGDVILFVDELHMLMSAGSHSQSSSPAAQILKPALARGEMKLIGATTTDEYRQIETDAAMERRLQPIDVPPLTPDQTAQVLFQTRSRYQKDDVIIRDEAIIAAAEWAGRYIEGNLPDRAIDLIDDAAAGKRMEGDGLVATADVSKLVEERTGIKPETSSADRAKLSGLEDELKARVIGQDDPVGAVARTVRRQQTLGDERPASLLFLGSSGVGKTELAKALASSLFGSERRMVRLDMSEFQDESGLNRMLGASRGYKDSEEGGQLTEAVRRQPYSVILMDEIEKANRNVLTILLQLLGDGRLTDGRGREVDFKNTIVIMTSNVGAQRVLAGEKDPAVVTEDLLAAGFLPELVGRIDERVVFHPLSGEDLQRIVRGLAGKVSERAQRRQGVELEVHETLIADIAERGHDPRFGARDIQNEVRRRIEDYFADLITRGYVGGDSGIRRVGLWYDAEDREDHLYDPQERESEERDSTEETGSQHPEEGQETPKRERPEE